MSKILKLKDKLGLSSMQEREPKSTFTHHSDSDVDAKVFQNLPLKKRSERRLFTNFEFLLIFILIAATGSLCMVCVGFAKKTLVSLEKSMEVYSQSSSAVLNILTQQDLVLKELGRSITDLKVQMDETIVPIKDSLKNSDSVIKKQEDQLLVFTMQMDEFKKSMRDITLGFKVKQSELNSMTTNYSKIEASMNDFKKMLKELAEQQNYLNNSVQSLKVR